MRDYSSWKMLGRWLLPLLVLSSFLGCTRARYRRAADAEVYGLIGCGTRDPRWNLPDYAITPKPASRMFDPDNPDRPPMPPDDPTAHQLMQCVDGMKGWPHWDRNGYTPYVENPEWLKYLTRTADGTVVLNRPTTVQVALLNSREYQRELEDLYLSALDVTFQRFRFDVQFFGSNSTFFTADGPDRGGAGGESSSLLTEDNSLQIHKLSATGAELLAGVANSLVWQFAGPDQYSATTLLDFSLVQPLLRAGGRAVVLENLTAAERALLANIRQMERFRHGFYAQIIAGSNPGIGPLRGGPSIEALNPSTAGAAGGILDLMEAQVRIRNQRTNAVRLRSSLDQFEAFYAAGRIDNLQVDQVRQSLYSAQSTLMSLQTSYQDSLDSFKLTLGLPPVLPIQIDDPLLKCFDLIDPQTTAVQEAIANVLTKLRDPEAPIEPLDYAVALEVVPRECRAVLSVVASDMLRFDQTIPVRQSFLQLLATRKELNDGDVDRSLVDLAAFQQRVSEIRAGFAEQRDLLLLSLNEFKQVQQSQSRNPTDDTAGSAQGAGQSLQASAPREALLTLMTRLGAVMAELALTQASARVESIALVPIELDSVQALDIARQNRLDWMNARAALVDAWRQVEVAANALRGDMSVSLSGDMSTLGNNPLQFRSTTGRLRAGLQFDPPLTRLAERNLYREALINYQQARRQYCAYEDRVSRSLRNTLRTINRYQLDFELRRAGVRVAIDQVDVMQLRLQKPPRPGEVSVFGATTGRDLVTALTGLLGAENSFLSAWVDYEVQRLNLDFDLGTMKLDAQNNWIDPGPIEMGHPDGGTDPLTLHPVQDSEEIPVPQPVAVATE